MRLLAASLRCDRRSSLCFRTRMVGNINERELIGETAESVLSNAAREIQEQID
jgi:hypothetical protein